VWNSGAEEIQKLFVFCRTVSETCKSIIVFSLFEAKSSHRKSYDTLFTENKETKSLNFAHRILHFVTSKPNTTSEFQGKKMSWKPKKGSLKNQQLLFFRFKSDKRELFFSIWGKRKIK
jgi:hypothetical protein